MNGTIKTQEDWWKLLDEVWWFIENNYNYTRLCTQGELEVAKAAKEARDWEPVWRLLQNIWGRAPDSPATHRWPRWGTLCDLCSESWVFAPPEEE